MEISEIYKYCPYCENYYLKKSFKKSTVQKPSRAKNKKGKRNGKIIYAEQYICPMGHKINVRK